MSEQTEPRVGERRPGGRAARVRASVLAAATELLAEVGYDRLSTDEVAKRAGVHRTTVYRRWPTKPELVADAVGLHAEEVVPIPDTGHLATDLRALAGAVAASNTSPDGSKRARSLVAAATGNDDLRTALNAFMTNRMVQSDPIVDRAVDRGEVPDDIDPRAIIEPVVGAIWFRLLLTGEPIDDAFLDQLVAVVEAGARAAGDGEPTTVPGP